MVVLEAMAYSIPIISTNISGIPELIRHGFNGYLISPGDMGGLVKYMNALIEDVSLIGRMGEESSKSVRGFAPWAVAEDWKKLYRACLP